ncbi:aldehyde dehydrogenase [candidate division KSB1 bacterium]|nr:aldehyde dehydrogenase [candidate division KSB1 bacterium]
MEKLEFYGLSIDGKRIPSSDEKDIKLCDPANGKEYARVAQATVGDVEKTVRIAYSRFVKGPWKSMDSRSRGQLLQRIANLIRDKSEYLAQLESKNVGKPINAARWEIQAAANTFEYYAGAINKVHGQTIPVAADGTLLTFREPLGVCALITPWNFPLLIASWKVAPAIAMGNTVIIKPATATPLSTLALADLALEAGIPSGVINVLPGSGKVVGSALVLNPYVRKISFTGSTEIGGNIMKMAGHDIKRISLELGGKSANIVFADTNLDDCIESSIFSVYDNAGQDCCSRSRILVEKPIFDNFVERFVQRAESLKIGLPQDENTEMGPLITPEHRDSVCKYLEIGEQEGAKKAAGGKIPKTAELSNGNFLTPAVFVDVDTNMRIFQEEIFGPVVTIMPFEDEEQAVEFANDSKYGLSGSVWTRDIGRALRVVRAFETGMISVNSSSSVHIEAPFGGMKQSGVGREQGMVALDHYSEYKSVFIASK